ncbi:large ribosomal subunit protein P1-like isoform X1 [Callospermophilus lateralis]|uniref:large ribosomal subunit protein P1-like isoform X1 n=1 Tax=Callospermophilus lateralis TaxID=76772 RepID=UPI00403890A6
MASVSGLACLCSVLIQHDNKVTIMEDKINALILKPGVNDEPFWLDLFAKALANVNTGSLICNTGASGPAPAAGVTTAGGPVPTTTASSAEEKKVEAKKEESEDSNDYMGFGLFD